MERDLPKSNSRYIVTSRTLEDAKNSALVQDYRAFEIVGVAASFISLTSYIPITIDVFTHPEAYLISITYAVYGLYIGANLLWLLYGIGHKSWAVIITSIIVIGISVIILIQISLFANRLKNNL